MKYILLILLIAMIASLLFTGCVTQVRGIELHIVDNETNKPLEGINVWYNIEKSKPKNIIDSEFETVVLKKMVTDKNGIVYIEPNAVLLGFFQNISSETIFLNIDVSDKKTIHDISEHLVFYFLSSFRLDYRDSKIFFPNENYYSTMAVNFLGDYNGYVKMQISDEVTNNNDNRFLQYSALSNMKEKPYAVIKIGLRRRESNMVNVSITNDNPLEVKQA